MVERAGNFQPNLAWNISTIFGVFEFLQVKLDARALREALDFQLGLNGSGSLPMSALGKDLVFALLMLDLKCLGVGMKSIWSDHLTSARPRMSHQ